MLAIEHNAQSEQKPQTIFLQSGRKVVYTKTKDGKFVCKYYGADGTQIKPEYFKKVEGVISIAEDNNSYTITKNGKKTKYSAKDSKKGQIDQNIVKLNNQEKKLNKTKNEQGFIGNSWDWFKNTRIGQGMNLDGSGKAQKQIEEERKLLQSMRDNPNTQIDPKTFEKVTGQKCTKANITKFQQGEISSAAAKVQGYQEGQEMAVDVGADIVSGIAAVGIYSAAVAAAPFTGGASIAVGIAVAGASGAAIKTGIKAADAATGGREYTGKDAVHDAATGAFSGVLAPITGGMGGAIGKTVATKLGIQAVKTVGKEVAEEVVETGIKQGIKTALTNPAGYEYVGGNIAKRGLAMAAEMASDGAVGGAADNAFRTALDGGGLSDVAHAAGEGFVGGLILSPVIGGWFKAVGKAGHELGAKIKGGSEVKIDANGNKVKVYENGKVVRLDKNNNELMNIEISQNNGMSMFTGFKNLTIEEKELLAKYNIYNSFGGQKSDIHSRITMKKKNPHPTNLTNELKRYYYRRHDMAKLFEDNPNLNRTVGALPRTWGKQIGSKDNFDAVDKCFSDFALAIKNKNPNAVQDLTENLSKVLNSKVEISFRGSGAVGRVHKLTVNGQSFALKTFFNLDGYKRFDTSGHGNWDELAAAVYASDKTKNAAKFYMGKFGEKSDEGYMLTKFISTMDKDNNIGIKRLNGDEHQFIDMISKFMTGDHDDQGNKIGWKYADYGKFGTTDFNNMSNAGYSILRQICKALDTNSQKQMKNIADRYKGSNELAEALKYFKSMLDDHLLMGKTELASRLRLLNTFESDEWKPNLIFLIKTLDDTALPAYGMTSKELHILYDIFSYKRL